MAPVRPKMRQSSSSRAMAKTPAKTPDRSLIKKPMRITVAQKQALIDNLQIEVTERARKLRAQYALQVQSLGTRIGLRVNRIPQQLRTTRIGDLLEKYAQAAENGKKPVTKAPAVAASLSKLASKRAPVPIAKAQPVTANATSPRGLKRKSDDIAGEEDKENTPDPSIPNPKKRAKPITRAAPNPATVLSPKSSNSRTVPQNTQRPPFGSHNPHLSRPTSPLKPASPMKVATTAIATMVGEKIRGAKALAEAAGRKTSKTKSTNDSKPAASRTRKAAPTPAPATVKTIQTRNVSGSSNASGTSTGTTIIKRIGRAAAPKPAPVTKKPPPKPAATKTAKPKAEAPAKRVLRKRVAA